MPRRLLRALVAPLFGTSILACAGPDFGDVVAGKVTAEPSDVAAVQRLLARAGRAPADLAILDDAGWSRGSDGVMVDGGRVVGLRLTSARLDHMGDVAGLPGLRRLDLSRNAIVRIDGLDGAARLEELYLRENVLVGLDGLGGCASLRLLYADGNRLATTAGLPRHAGLIELVLNRNVLVALPGVAGLPALTGLHVADNRLPDLDDVHDLPALVTLVASNNAIASVSGLRSVPALRYVTLANNQLADVGALASLPALARADVSNNRLTRLPALGAAEVVSAGNPLATPAAGPAATTTTLTTTGAFAAEAGKTGRVDALPEGSGSMRGGPQSSSSGSGAEGRISTLRGGPLFVSLWSRSWSTSPQRADVDVQLSVSSGRVRLYLPDDAGGYRWWLAEPGAPVRVRSRMASRGAVQRTEYGAFVEAVDGEATGIAYKVERPS